MREPLFMECTECGERYYRTTKNAKATVKIELKKFCSNCRKHTPHKEKKK
ncbi:MAG: 50S ribosomal protein L33 [Planctomycetota bacterium]